jgi:hypothetical protein
MRKIWFSFLSVYTPLQAECRLLHARLHLNELQKSKKKSENLARIGIKKKLFRLVFMKVMFVMSEGGNYGFGQGMLLFNFKKLYRVHVVKVLYKYVPLSVWWKDYFYEMYESYFLNRHCPDIFWRHTVNEGPVRIQYKCLVPIYVFPEMKLLFPKQNYNVLSPSSYTHISVRDLYFFPRLVYPFCCREICGPILGIYKSITDTWMWKLGLRPRNSQKRNT